VNEPAKSEMLLPVCPLKVGWFLVEMLLAEDAEWHGAQLDLLVLVFLRLSAVVVLGLDQMISVRNLVLLA
jgi:hypothetical protein